MTENLHEANEETRAVWNENADFWDTRMGEGNDFVNLLEWPAIERLLALQPGERVLDAACGNGLTSRRMAALGAQVTAFDFAPEMIVHARRRSADSAREGAQPIQYHVLDATDEAALLSLGEGQFDAALCNMALMDMAEIQPLMRALAKLLRPGGRFVFALTHPCFNGDSDHVAEMSDRGGEVKVHYSIKVGRYLTPSIQYGVAINGQPRKQLYFFRPLHVLLGYAFEAGFVLNGLEEPAFSPGHPTGSNPLSWSGHFSEIPPVLVGRVVNSLQ